MNKSVATLKAIVRVVPIPWNARVAAGALEDGPIGPFQALTKLGQELVLVVTAQVQEPLERVQHEPLDAADRESAARSPAAAPPKPSATTIR